MVPAVRVVLLNYNGGNHVLRAVEHAVALDWPADRLEIVVVDNASTDRSPQRIQRAFPGVQVLHNAVNTGFSANNLAMRDTDDVAYVALVNPDAFVEPGWLRALVDAMESDEGLGAACPKMLLAPQFVDLEIETSGHRVAGDSRSLGVRVSGLRVGGVDRIAEVLDVAGLSGPEQGRHDAHFRWTSPTATLGVPIDGDSREIEIRLDSGEPKDVTIGGSTVRVDTESQWYPVRVDTPPYDVINNAGSLLVEGGWGADRGLGCRDGAEFEEPREVFAWCGGGVLLRATYLRDVGVFDEDFFLYYEDTDLSWRGRGLGWRYGYVPSARMRHLHGASTVVGSPLFVVNVERNRLVMLAKNAPPGFAAGAFIAFLRSTAGIARDQIVRPVLRRRRPDTTTVRLRLVAFWSAMCSLPRTLRKRRQIRRRMLVADEELLRWQTPQP